MWGYYSVLSPNSKKDLATFLFDTTGAKMKKARKLATKEKRRLGNFALCGGRPTLHGVGSVPPFEKGGRKLLPTFDSANMAGENFYPPLIVRTWRAKTFTHLR